MMNILKLTIQSAMKRPVIIVLPAVLMLVLAVLNSYNPVFPILMGLSSATGSSVFDSVVSTLQLLLDPAIIPIAILFIIGSIILVSLLTGIVLSGYFYIVDKALGGSIKTEGDFQAGIKKFFTGIFIITLKATLFTAFFSGFIAIATVPAIIITRAATTTKPELLPAAVFVDLLTMGVVFFSLMFSRIYLFYWYPAAINEMERPFSAAKRIVDGHFWEIVLRFFIFDIVFIVFQYLILISGALALKLLLSWIFSTLFFTIMVVFVFHSFRRFADLVQNQDENTQSQ